MLMVLFWRDEFETHRKTEKYDKYTRIKVEFRELLKKQHLGANIALNYIYTTLSYSSLYATELMLCQRAAAIFLIPLAHSMPLPIMQPTLQRSLIVGSPT